MHVQEDGYSLYDPRAAGTGLRRVALADQLVIGME